MPSAGAQRYPPDDEHCIATVRHYRSLVVRQQLVVEAAHQVCDRPAAASIVDHGNRSTGEVRGGALGRPPGELSPRVGEPPDPGREPFYGCPTNR